MSLLKMMKLYILLLAMLVGSMCDDTADNVVDVGQTVKEVESILAEDPNLPRLTRGEIINLIEEVRNGKDLMVVLPQQFNATLEEMYTAKPVTQIIQDNGEVKTTKRPKRRRKPIRPVYIHSTTTSSSVSDSSTSTTTSETLSSSEEIITEDWKPKIYITPSKFSTTPLPSTTTRTTTETSQIKPDISGAVESLSPDMKELLSSFGLLGNNPVKAPAEVPNFMVKSISPTVDPSSYSRFKPLPSTFEGMSPDMRSFLAAYGLLDSRQGKSKQIQPIDPLEFLPHQDVLDDLGLRNGKKLSQHVFNPNSIKNSTEELNKVNKILMKLREFSEGNATDLNEDEINELILLENNTRLTSGEDPLDTSSSLKNKIEVKRQQPNDTDITAENVTTTTTELSMETTTEASSDTSEEITESSVSPDDLEESFGGVDTLRRRPNGFYFLLDWNSFLDVGLDERKVSLNFSPKVGEPRNFIPVTIP